MSRTKNSVMKCLVDTYIYKGYDILNFRISKNNALTYHHIIKQEDLKALGFKTTKTIENGIPLTRTAHIFLHFIEYQDPDIFYDINKIILLITKEQRLPTPEERALIQVFLQEFEYHIEGYRELDIRYLKRTKIS